MIENFDIPRSLQDAQNNSPPSAGSFLMKGSEPQQASKIKALAQAKRA